MITNLKLMDFAKRVNEMEVGETIDFANSDIDVAEWYGGWCGVKRNKAFGYTRLQFLGGSN